MITFPNAKINIGLNIIEKRSDGFHNIESVFYPVQWRDVLEIIVNDKNTPNSRLQIPNSIEFTSSGLEIPGSTDSNLIIKAYKLLEPIINQKEEAKSQIPNLKSKIIQIHLHKVIPMGAGLGGGSADGAFALKMLNEIFELELSNEDLKNYARKLGSDCAFFIENRPVFCYQKGDQFENFSLDLSNKFIVLVNPSVHISTAEAYSGVLPKTPQVSLKEVLQQPIKDWREIVRNDFEEKLLIKYPIIAQVKQKLYDSGAAYASMTGSGSTVYGIFENEINLSDQFGTFAVWSGVL